jgi:hypothetical protein
MPDEHVVKKGKMRTRSAQIATIQKKGAPEIRKALPAQGGFLKPSLAEGGVSLE